MSWDIFVQDYPKDATTIADVPGDFKPMPIGTRTDLIRQIKEAISDADFSDPSWGIIRRDDFSIEVNMGSDEQVLDIALHVRGSNAAASMVAIILHHLGLRAYDSGTGDFFDPMRPIAGLQLWRDFLAKVEKAFQGNNTGLKD